ncbi:MAG: chromosomal replication initiator protein DnaA [Burkholderiales bacterium]|nr:chromosomal replication initiator protein DnaA [Burkholderiales bacterium]
MPIPFMHPLWLSCVEDFKKELSQHQFTTWIKPLSFLQDGDNFTLLAPNRFVLQWAKDRILARVEQAGEKYFARPCSIELALLEGPVASEAVLSERDPTVQELGAQSGASGGSGYAGEVAGTLPYAAAAVNNRAAGHRINPAFTFASFIGGKANQLARAAAHQVGQNPGQAYNPLFVYGATGLGKTHLVQAIGNLLLEHNPNANIRYIHAERFVTDVVQAYQHKAFDAFKRSYHTLDLLLIDDIQFFGGKSRTQEEFFYAFNALIEGGKQVVITSDRFPKEIANIDDRLISRFGWGLTVSVEPPELEMRVAILIKKAESEGIPLDEEVAFFIAKHIRSNVRELEGGLKRVLAYTRFNNVPISVGAAKEALKDLLAVLNRQISIDNIQKTVADYYKIKVSEMYSKKRVRSLARPRQVAMALAKELTPMSLPEIGEAFGGRDHTTVLHACRKVRELVEADQMIARDHSLLMQILRG